MDSSKQASAIFKQPVDNRSSLWKVVNRMCQIFLLMNFSVKLLFHGENVVDLLQNVGTCPERFKTGKFPVEEAFVR